jgi:hypothetical protein
MYTMYFMRFEHPGHTYGGFISDFSEWGMTKGSLPLRKGVRDPIPPSPCKLVELSAHPFVTPLHLQYQAIRRRAIISKEGPELG